MKGIHIPKQPKGIIVTLQLEADDERYFNELRRKYFPKHHNYVEAHLTILHHLPLFEPLGIQVLAPFAQRRCLHLQVEGLRNMGKGVAFSIRSDEFDNLHKDMQREFEAILPERDRQIIWPHITIQNKVTSFQAQKLWELMSREFEPFTINATGIGAWYYLKGRWQTAAVFPFL